MNRGNTKRSPKGVRSNVRSKDTGPLTSREIARLRAINKTREKLGFSPLNRVIVRTHKEKYSLLKHKSNGIGVVFIGPSVEGGDKVYKKVLTGDVDHRDPSFI